MVLKIGPVKAKFSGNVTLDTKAAPTNLSLEGAGDGGLAGFAKGGADVELIDHGDKTILRYNAKAETGGKIAQLGARLIESTAKKLAKKFFGNKRPNGAHQQVKRQEGNEKTTPWTTGQ